MKPLVIVHNQKYVRANASLLQDLTPGIMPGQGVFETMAIYHGKVCAFNEHYHRLQRGLKLFHIRQQFSRSKIEQWMKEVIRRNHITRGRIRLAIWRFEKQQHMAIVAQKVKPVSSTEFNKGYKVTVSSIQRNQTRYSHIKSIDYQLFREALTQAKKQGFDEAILLNKHKYIVEGAISNIFIIKNNKLFTPAIRCGCLNGITRQIVIAIARRLGMSVQIGEWRMNKIKQADELFLTNSLLEIMPVRSVDGFKIGRTGPGQHTVALHREYQKIVKNSVLNCTPIEELL